MTEWDEYAADWDADDAVQAYAEAAFGSLAFLAEEVGVSLRGATACDFGCGTGLLTERLAGRCAHIDAVDASLPMRDQLRTKIERHRWEHVRLLDRLPATSQEYDLIVCSSVLGFVDDYPGMVETLVAHLAPGGLFVQWDWERNPDDDEPYGLTRTDIRAALESAGLRGVVVGRGFEATVGDDTMSPLMGSGRR